MLSDQICLHAIQVYWRLCKCIPSDPDSVQTTLVHWKILRYWSAYKWPGVYKCVLNNEVAAEMYPKSLNSMLNAL